MKKFKDYFENKESNQKFIRLAVYDFDGTLSNTPEKPTSGDMRSWNKKDWYGSAASLTSPEEGGFYDGSVNPEVINAMKQDKTDPTCKTIVLTGRRTPSANYVRKILQTNGLYGRRVIDPLHKHHDQLMDDVKKNIHPEEMSSYAHEEFFTGDHVVTNGIHGTLGHKKHVLEKLVMDNGGFQNLDLWDDRAEHLNAFKSIAEELQKKNLVQRFTIHQVFPPKQIGQHASIVNFTLQPDGTWKGHQ